MALVSIPAIGSASNKPVQLKVRISGHRAADENQGEVLVGMRKFFQQREFCDAILVCEEQEFHVHKCVLAAKSEVFRTLLKDTNEIRFSDIANPEAVRWMLDYFYEIGYGVSNEAASAGLYTPASQAINADVLRLAQKYELPALRARATLFMTKELSTHNAVERLAICDEFGLTELRERILEQLTANKKALAEVTSSPAITAYPTLMREMLALIATSGGGAFDEQPNGPAKKKLKR